MYKLFSTLIRSFEELVKASRRRACYAMLHGVLQVSHYFVKTSAKYYTRSEMTALKKNSGRLTQSVAVSRSLSLRKPTRRVDA